MAERLDRTQIAAKATLHEAPAPVLHGTTVDRGLELPAALYGAVVAFFLGFLAITALAFRTPELLLPMVIFVVSIAGGFGLPAVWATMKPENPTRPLSWDRFLAKGIMTHTGPVTARDATAQVIVLPALIFLWGVTVVAIAAMVR